jgi:hypothetical protein
LATAALTAALFSAEAQTLHRFALIAGNDRGGGDTRPLLYAQDDARKIYDIFRRLGGVRAEDSALLLNQKADEVLLALGRLEAKARDAGQRGERTLLLVYYSGHAKDGALRLEETQIPLESLKGRLAQASADVKIGIFDSCRSGMLTRTKGARKMPEFEVESDVSRSARGLVILASSASDEDSQESDQIGGSYFSHYLASGLLGDADGSRDGRVTLSEAYTYAYNRTVADTAESAAGAQHPTYSFDLAGNGEVVLTDLTGRHEGLLFPAAAPPGAYFLIDGKGFVSAEIWKEQNVERRIALPPGTYHVKRRLIDRLRVGQIHIASGRFTTFEEAQLRDVSFSDDPIKGPGRREELAVHWSFGVGATYQSFFDAPTRNGLFPPAPLIGVEGQIHNFLRPDWIWGFDIAVGSSQGSLSLTTFNQTYHFSELMIGTSILVQWPLGPWEPYAGGRLALLVMNRRFDDPLLPHQDFTTFSPGIVLGSKYRLSRHWGLNGRVRIHYLLYNVDENRSLGFWEITALLFYEM